MNKTEKPSTIPSTAARQADVPFGSNDVRLSPVEWIVAATVVAAVVHFLPVFWQRIEPLEVGADYRIPYRLGYDYCMVRRYFREASATDKTLVVGDSVAWGHYVAEDETLSHYLNELAGEERFANLGVDGIHPVALAGLIEHYGGDVSGKDVVLNCNLLWMSSERHDLQTKKEFSFNHPTLVPQFYPCIPCYREKLSGRIGIAVGREVPFLGWIKHVQIAYFDSAEIPRWVIEHPYESPAAAVTLRLPSAGQSPESDPRPWTQNPQFRPFNPAWVELDGSLQWHFFRRTVHLLRRQGNRVFVLVGPFNVHMLLEDSPAVYQRRMDEVRAWLDREGVPHYAPPPLPSELYADASHPLAEGYRRLAEQLFQQEAFRPFRESP